MQPRISRSLRAPEPHRYSRLTLAAIARLRAQDGLEAATRGEVGAAIEHYRIALLSANESREAGAHELRSSIRGSVAALERIFALGKVK